MAAWIDPLALVAAVECDRPGCYAVVVVARLPGRPHQTPAELLQVVVDGASEQGWLLAGRALCPDHAPPALGRPQRIGDVYPWVNVVKGAR